MKHVHAWLMAAAMAIPFSQALAFAKNPTPPDVKADTKEKFDGVVDHVHEEMGAGGRFEFLTAEERATVEHDLDDMHGLFDRFGNVDAMDDPSRIQLYNDQSEVNALLTRRDGDREICTHEQPTGSHLPKTTCRNYGQMERERRDMLNMKDAMLHTMREAAPSSALGTH